MIAAYVISTKKNVFHFGHDGDPFFEQVGPKNISHF